jgi:hypothetical protein
VTLEDVLYRLVADRRAQVGEGTNDPIVAPGAILLARRTTKASSSGSMGGRPGTLRGAEPSHFWATSVRCQPSLVSGVTIMATSSSACGPRV